MKYALFTGCLIPAREPSYELSVRMVLPELGVEIADMQDTNCCAPFSIQSVNSFGWMTLAARNLCIAEEMELDILTLCADCYESLSMVNDILKKNQGAREDVNEILSEAGKEFQGKIDVKHMLDVLYDDVGLEKIKEAIKRPFVGLKVGTQVGCHLVRPKMLFLGAEREYKVLDDLVRVTGAEVLDYEEKEHCCGGPLRDVNDKLARLLARQKIISMKRMGIDCVVTVCPFCFIQFDVGQLEMKSLFGEVYNLPVLHYVELLRLAMGIDLTDLEIRSHKIPLNQILEKRV